MSRAPILLELPGQIDTARLTLRPPRAGDGAVVLAAVCDSLAELRCWPANLPWAAPEPALDNFETFCRRAEAQFLLREDFTFLIRRSADGQLVGACGLHRFDWLARRFEIGYWGHTPSLGHGYLSEAVCAIRDLGLRQLHARRLEIFTDARNHRSRALAERCGFTLEHIRPHGAETAHDERPVCAVYALTA
ncbi:GNAT family N-acetyltransferase [Niveibacterium sp.]|uniref:GNAT family N-acetyltransferase n=1 Tax=Niveibacterium sp. TaxID=2017444 RepID=UPI0035AE049C